HPAGIVASHSGVADKNILDSFIEGVTHMQHARDIGGRDNDGKSRTVIRSAIEITPVHPVGIPFLFSAGWNIVLAQLHGHTNCISGGKGSKFRSKEGRHSGHWERKKIPHAHGELRYSTVLFFKV